MSDNIGMMATSERPLKYSTTRSGLRFIDISDEFVAWLSFANAGMLNRGNLYCMDLAISQLASRNPIVEIGSFCGLSTNLIGYYMARHGRTNPVITCDKWEFEGVVGETLGESSVSHAGYRQFVKESFKRNVSFFSEGRLPHTVEKVSNDFFTAWDRGEECVDVFGRPIRLGGPISFAYIDGNHSYEFALRDFQNVDKHLERGGFVLFDDSADGSEWGVNQVVREIQADRGDLELVVKNPNYLFRKR